MNSAQILVVDDEAAVRESLRRALALEGYDVELAADGAEALYRLDIGEVQPDAIVLDMGLPVMDGWTVLDQLKHHSSTRHIPVHIVSAGDGKANALSFDIIESIGAALEEAEDDAQIGAVVLHGRPGRFSAGFDLKRYVLESYNTNNFIITTEITNSQGSQITTTLFPSPQPSRRNETTYLPLSLNADYFQTAVLDYSGGARYPHLERVSSTPDRLADIFRPRAGK